MTKWEAAEWCAKNKSQWRRWPRKGVKLLCEELGISRQAFYLWGEYPPYHWQKTIEELTFGELKATEGT